MSTDALLLLALLLVAHYLGDFTPLATPAMRQAKTGKRPPGPILAHAAVHAGLVLAAVLIVIAAGDLRPAWQVVLGAGALELGTHFAIDFAKMKLGVRHAALRDPSRGPFWQLFGADQLAHGLVLLAIAGWAVGGGM